MNKLCGTRCYLIGAMDRVTDGGVGWRDKASEFLKELGVVLFNPCLKHEILDQGREDIENRERRKNLKIAKNYDAIAADVKEIRSTDLRMVDVCDFMVVNIDTNIHACGSYEEITTANRQKKPILIHLEQGKTGTPDWLFGMIPHQHIFSDWSCLYDYLAEVNSSKEAKTYNRWVFFNLAKPTLTALLKAADHDSELFDEIKDWLNQKGFSLHYNGSN